MSGRCAFLPVYRAKSAFAATPEASGSPAAQAIICRDGHPAIICRNRSIRQECAFHQVTFPYDAPGVATAQTEAFRDCTLDNNDIRAKPRDPGILEEASITVEGCAGQILANFIFPDGAKAEPHSIQNSAHPVAVNFEQARAHITIPPYRLHVALAFSNNALRFPVMHSGGVALCEPSHTRIGVEIGLELLKFDGSLYPKNTIGKTLDAFEVIRIEVMPQPLPVMNFELRAFMVDLPPGSGTVGRHRLIAPRPGLAPGELRLAKL